MNGKAAGTVAVRGALVLLALLVQGAAPSALGVSPAGPRLLEKGQLQGWQRRDFSGVTRYDTDVLDGEPVLRARARGSASGLYLTRTIDLADTPVLRWRWRVEAPLDNRRETRREGDDFAARVYVVAADPVLFWKTRAICYVWASAAATGQVWPNPYVESVKMVVLRSGAALSGRWVAESRDVAADFQRLFGEVPRRIDATAIMTDTDDTGQSATAWYDDLHWSGRS